MMQLFPPHLLALAESVAQAARAKKMRIVTAESCTGGLIAACLTEIPGASDILDQGFVTYSNDAKMSRLGVSPQTLQEHGPVSAITALEMAHGALHASTADIAISTTGLAGPSGGSAKKPVGLVHMAIARRSDDSSHGQQNIFTGDRTEIRLKALESALTALKSEIEKN
jgi:nicotinamide-nucleotide amidase